MLYSSRYISGHFCHFIQVLHPKLEGKKHFPVIILISAPETNYGKLPLAQSF